MGSVHAPPKHVLWPLKMIGYTFRGSILQLCLSNFFPFFNRNQVLKERICFLWSRFFLFTVNPLWNICHPGKQPGSQKSCSLLEKWLKNMNVYPYTLIKLPWCFWKKKPEERCFCSQRETYTHPYQIRYSKVSFSVSVMSFGIEVQLRLGFKDNYMMKCSLHGFEVWIDKSIMSATVWHPEAFHMMRDSDLEAQSFLFLSHTYAYLLINIIWFKLQSL